MQSQTYRVTVLYIEFTEKARDRVHKQPLQLEEIRALSAAVTQVNGQVAELTPERLYAIFPRAPQALPVARKAVEMVEHARRTQAQRQTLTAKALLGYGDIALENGRLQSDWTYKFSRLCSYLPDNSVGALQDYLQQAGVEAGTPRPGAVAGLFVLSGEEVAETRMGSSFAAVQSGIFNELSLRVRGQVKVIRPVDCPVLVGRDKTCGVQVSSDTASRIHGRVEYDNSKFFYVDQSRNGTYILNSSGEEVHLNQGENLVLAGEGAISTGSPIAEQKGEVIRYSCRTTKLSLDLEEGDTKTQKRQ